MDHRPTLEWKEDYSVGVAEIDEQHKKIIEFVRELETCMSQNKDSTACKKILFEMSKYSDYHFATEEKYFREYGYEDKDEHIKEHVMYRARVKELKKMEREANNEEISRVIFKALDFLEDWWVGHLTHTDRKYIECFKKAGLK